MLNLKINRITVIVFIIFFTFVRYFTNYEQIKKIMEIKILGTGCPKCKTLEKVTREAVAELGLQAEIIKEEDIIKIMNYGIMHTPGLVINGRVVLSGQVPSLNQVKDILIKDN